MRVAMTAGVASLLILRAAAVSAQTPPCAPCVGLAVDDPEAVVRLLGDSAPLKEGARLYVRCRAPLDGTADPGLAGRVATAGATPWLVLSFSVPSPIADHASELARELEEAARLAAADFDNDGDFDDASGTLTPTFTLVGQDGVYPIRLKASAGGAFTVVTTTVTVNNVAPRVSLASNAPVDEGSVVTVGGTVTDPGWLDPS